MKYKKLLFAIIFVLFSIHSFSQKTIEFQPYAGFIYAQDFGVQMGGDFGIPITKYFYVQSGILFYKEKGITARDPKWKIAINIPVCASFRIPVNHNLSWKVNIGPYGGVASVGQFGCMVGVGCEVKNVYIGTTCYQNCITDKSTQIGLLAGYKFLF